MSVAYASHKSAEELSLQEPVEVTSLMEAVRCTEVVRLMVAVSLREVLLNLVTMEDSTVEI